MEYAVGLGDGVTLASDGDGKVKQLCAKLLFTMKWVVFIKNAGFEASSEARKLYNAENDEKAQSFGMIRMVDKSGEGYL